MKICLATLIVTLLTSLPMLAQQSSSTAKANSETTAAKTEHIEGKGCVKPGRQKGCFVVNDIKAHRKYNVFFDGKSQPDMYTAISFEGIGYQHVSHCSQGQKVQVTEWKPLPGECSKPNVTQGKPQ